jgi:Peptidase family M23
VLAGISAQSARAQSPSTAGGEGTWSGILGGGARQLHLIVTISRAADGTYSGTLDSVDQGATLPLDNIKISGASFHFEVGRVGGVYDGTLNASQTMISGNWTQTGVPPQPLAFQRGEAAAASAAPAQPAPSAKPAEQPGRPLTSPLNVVVPEPPTLFKADGKYHLVYELHVSNYGKADCSITAIEVVSGDSSARSLATFSGKDLDGLLYRPGQPTASKSLMSPGSTSVVFMWVTFDKREDVPSSISHKITTKQADYADTITVEIPPTPVLRQPVVVIASALEGDNWLAGNGPSNTSVHRRALIPIDGHAYISQRYAIDWVRLYPDGKTYNGDPRDNKSYRAFGTEIHAVADGVVTEIKDGIPENVPNGPLAVPITLDTIGGNHVLMQIGDGLFAFYAHLQPGSLRVKVGDKVRRGQVLGLLGNTGNSSEPHLHFQICNANSELGSVGLPYALASFEVQGKGWTWKSSDARNAPVKYEMEIPTEDEVVRFANTP